MFKFGDKVRFTNTSWVDFPKGMSDIGMVLSGPHESYFELDKCFWAVQFNSEIIACYEEELTYV